MENLLPEILQATSPHTTAFQQPDQGWEPRACIRSPPKACASQNPGAGHRRVIVFVVPLQVDACLSDSQCSRQGHIQRLVPGPRLPPPPTSGAQFSSSTRSVLCLCNLTHGSCCTGGLLCAWISLVRSPLLLLTLRRRMKFLL